MPISNYVPRNMRMNVSQFLMYNLGLKNCNYNPEKQDIREISKDSMQCCVNNIKETAEVKKFINEESIEKINPIESVPKHNFIPYPDHNYGQQPPLTPPEETAKVEEFTEQQQQPSAPTTDIPSLSDQNLTENEEEQEGVTRCICGFEHDDGYMICCDNCSSWQHIECMGIKSSKVPEKYSCHKCSPRELDIEGAKAIQAKKRENMSEDDDEDDEETCSEDETSKTMYTAISNTPTRITLLSNTSQQSMQGTLKNKNRRGSKVPKKKLSDQRNTRRKTKRKEKTELPNNDDSENLFPDSNTLNDFISAHKLYEEIEENKYDEEFKNMHFKLPEAVPAIDFKNMVKCHHIQDVSRNRKGLIALFDIPCGNFILEYKGTLMSRKKFEDSCGPIFKSCCPYVVNYNKIDHMLLVIDARDYGNDARFIRRSCTPNADLQHITSNGSLHIMIISKANILQDKEITVPFDFTLDYFKGQVECACNLEGCIIKKQNEELKQANKIANTDLIANHLKPPSPNNIIPLETSVIKTEGDDAAESESELNGNSEESKHEKLSREERKLQAYMKQFEKLEKKQDTGKKGKDPKTPILKVTPDENTTPVPTPVVKPILPKKVIGGKRKISFVGKRRTRQSSGSSEPLSPTEHLEATTCNVATPTTPVVSTNSAEQNETTPHVLCRQRSRKGNGDKEPLTLTLPIQRKDKVKHEATLEVNSTTPTDAVAPASPAKSAEQSAALSLSVDTEMENTPLKTNNLNGLLQIAQAPKTPVTSSASSSVGASTCEEKIGDVTIRNGDNEAPPVTKPLPCIPSAREGNLHRKYYGSIKKHWLRQYSQIAANSPNGLSNGFKQISLAALMASLSRQHLPSSISPVGKSSCIPKRRHLLRAMKLKNEAVAAACTTGNIPAVCNMMNSNPDLLLRGNERCITETNFNVITDVARCGTLTCSNMDYVSLTNVYSPHMTSIMEDNRTTRTMDGGLLAGSNTRLTYSLTPSHENEMNDTTNSVNSLHSVLFDKNASNLHEPLVAIAVQLQQQQNMNTGFTDVHCNMTAPHIYTSNSNYHPTGIIVCQAAMNTRVSVDDTDAFVQQGTLLVNSVQSSTPLLQVSEIKTITSEICSVIKTTNSRVQSGYEAGRTRTISDMTSTYQQQQPLSISSSSNNASSVSPPQCTQTTVGEASVSLIVTGNTAVNTTSNTSCLSQQQQSSMHNVHPIKQEPIHALSQQLQQQQLQQVDVVDNDEPSCKKQRIDVNEENSSDMGLKIVITEPSSMDVAAYNSNSNSSNTSCDSNVSLLISSQKDFNGDRPNSLGNTTHLNNNNNMNNNVNNNNNNNNDNDNDNNYNDNHNNNPQNSNEMNVDSETNSSLSQGDAGTGGKKKLSFKEYRNRRSQKAPITNISHLSTTTEQSTHIPSMPVSPAQKINQAAGLLLTPRTVSLLNFDKSVVSTTYANNLEGYMPIVSTVNSSVQQQHRQLETNASAANGVLPPNDSSRIMTAEINSTSQGQDEGKLQVPHAANSNNDQQQPGTKPSSELYGSNAGFEPVSPGNDYDSESPVDESVAYLNTIHTDITKNPFSIHNDITKHPFGKKPNQNQNCTSELAEIDDDASSTHSNMSSTSYGSVSEVAHERSYHQRSYSREHSASREYSSCDQQPRDGREYYPPSSHPSFTSASYYQSYNQTSQQPITRTSATGTAAGVQRIPGFQQHHNNYPLSSSNQTPRQRQTHRGYIPF